MSRTIPAGNTPSPVTRWFELDGAEGGVRYYDKEKKEQIEVGKKFGFILLDQLAVVKGWHAVRTIAPPGLSSRFHSAHSGASGITESHLQSVVPYGRSEIIASTD